NVANIAQVPSAGQLAAAPVAAPLVAAEPVDASRVAAPPAAASRVAAPPAAASRVAAPSVTAPSVVASSFSFFTLTPPCRVFDSRQSTALQTGVARTIPVAGSCGVPADAK